MTKKTKTLTDEELLHELKYANPNSKMHRSRPYNGQAHTDHGKRGKTKIKGVTFRDLRDAYVRAYCLASSGEAENVRFYEEAKKGQYANLDENDIFKLAGDVDPVAVAQNMACEVEKLMGIYPNIDTDSILDEPPGWDK
jgi:hypothetical protein